MSKPIDIIDEFGDRCLSCSKCKEPIHFPLFSRVRPEYCIKCLDYIDWSEDDE